MCGLGKRFLKTNLLQFCENVEKKRQHAEEQRRGGELCGLIQGHFYFLFDLLPPNYGLNGTPENRFIKEKKGVIYIQRKMEYGKENMVPL